MITDSHSMKQHIQLLILLVGFASCQTTYTERGNSSWHVQTNTQDEKKTKSEKHPGVISESTQQIINEEKSPLLIKESPGLKGEIKESFAPVKTQVNQLRQVIRENKNPLSLKTEMIKTVRSKEFRKVSSKNMGQKIGLYIIWGSLLLTVLGFVFLWESIVFMLAAVIGILLLIVGLLILLGATIAKK